MIERLGSDLDKSASVRPRRLNPAHLHLQLKCRTASMQPSAP